MKANWSCRQIGAALVAGLTVLYSSSSAIAADARQYLVSNPPAVMAKASDGAVLATISNLGVLANQKGSLRLIVGLRVPFAPEGNISGVIVAQQRSEIAASQQSLGTQLSKVGATIHAAYTTIPFVAVTVSPTGLNALLNSPDVISLEEDRLAAPTLAQSVPLIGGDTAWGRGYSGAGQHVAILDTGVDKTHSFLTGKVVSEACYSTNSPGDTASSVCPGGVTSSTAVGSGVNCNVAVDGCTHGTHVAGITAGNGASFSGVAKDASLIAIQVFSRFEVSSGYCAGVNPCALSYNSDQIKGLERVYALRGTYSIASVNMSLGGGRYYNQASCDSATASTKAAIDNLRSVNIATVIASGNNGYSDSMGSPGCISTAVSVGATTKSDVVASYSNGVSFLNLLAPGSSINSSIPGNAYASWNGTSMATPHVAGAWAVLKGGKPTATVTEILNALYTTGADIVDARNSLHFRRINVNSALTALVPPASSAKTDDFNGDSKSDILWQQNSNGYAYMGLMNGTAATSTTWVGGGTDWIPVGNADYSGDAKSDLLWQQTSTGFVHMWLMNGATQTSSAYVGGGAGWSVPRTGDFNGDGKRDILWRQPGTGYVYMALMNGTTTTSLTFIGGGTDWSVVGTGDYNGDGKTDILWQQNSTGYVFMWLMNGTTMTSSAYVGGGTGWSVAGSADFNGDGKADILWKQSPAGYVYMTLMNGATTTSSSFIGGSTDWSVVATGDYNGDGKSDILWQQTSTGFVYMWLMNGATTTSSTYTGGGTGWYVRSRP